MNTKVGMLKNLFVIITCSVGKVNDNSKLQPKTLHLSQQHPWCEPQVRWHPVTQTLTYIVLLYTDVYIYTSVYIVYQCIHTLYASVHTECTLVYTIVYWHIHCILMYTLYTGRLFTNSVIS